MLYICHITCFYLREKMVNKIDIIKIHILSKLEYELINEIVQNKEFDDKDIVDILMLIKNILNEIDTTLTILIRTTQKNNNL
ncbi:hypothetical protein CCL42_gp31 [Sulfolobus islandicus rod-shaped virus 8]|uniref:Uncharacterized protein n=2 Tax=Usarudivirus TaxID=2843109 RepID=A0A1X9SJI2_9VIRU|nr:hypothetical protein CCL41_gp29 [Sulfolobus islandicus rod-shaped virus 9]YP_009362704.1 hypothetical protein CCL42_gp31 [Sulfolobus islandicus rod-shaped virus 8]ARQ96377.1 hypothetical protein [Sulfolobus islandicus rod-shaped virus 9]ARQ96437.1 hypothetical protein [Sulfolobus islandicus rod-shaped virus 8]